MGLFNRKKVAGAFGVSASRVSQMASSGEIISPVDDEDGLDSGWPETYVQEVAARRQGRQTSRSVYGVPAPAAPYTPIADTIVESKHDGHAFVQLVDVDGERIGLITSLQDIIRHTNPLKDQLGTRTREALTWSGDDLLPAIRSAANDFNTSVFDVAWVHLGDLYATEIVITSEPTTAAILYRRERFATREQIDETTRIERLPWETLHNKLGAPVPVLAAPTVDAVEKWRQDNRTPSTKIVFDSAGYYNKALAASLLADLLDKDTPTPQPQREDALALAISRINADIPWEESGELDIPYFVEANDAHVEPLTIFRTPAFDHHNRLEGKLLDNTTRTTAERQTAANALGYILHSTYGEYGDSPSPALAYALEQGIRATITLTRDEWSVADLDLDNAVTPRFHSTREVTLRHSPQAATYAATLEEPLSTKTPDHRLLNARRADSASFETVHSSRILTDTDSNYVLVQTISDYGDENPYEALTILVPTAGLATRNLDHLKDFTEIIVDADTQQGPIWLRLHDDSIHIMPFGSATTAGFTHGYGGTGPGNLADALRGFLEWATNGTITKSGRDKLTAIVVGSDQRRDLHISRSQVIQPGAFTPTQTD